MKKLIFALVCFVASFAFVSCGSKEATPTSAAENSIELMKAKDYQGFIETIHFTGETPEEIEQQKQFYLGMIQGKADKTITKRGGIESYTLISEEIAEDGNTAKLQYELTYGDGTKDKSKFNMIKVDGKWMNEIKK